MTKYIISLVFLIFSSLLWSQTDTQKKLEEKKARLMEEIQYNEKLLKEQKNK